MSLTKVSGDVIQGTINVGVVTATRIDGNVSGDINSVGVSTFSTLKVGTTVNINGGIVTATTFSGNLTGNVTGNATGLSGTPNITVGSITAASAVITGNVSVAGTVTYEDTTNVDSIGVITARSGVYVTGGGVIVSGVTTVSAGSTATPSISPSGDSNTGIFFPSPDTVAIAEGGVEALRIDSSGRLGIGTNNPSDDIDIFKNSSSSVRLKSSTSGTNILLDSSTTPSVSNQITFALNGSTKWAIGGANVGAAGSTKFSLFNYTANNNSFTVDGNNNFLIGTVNATGTSSQALQVNSGAYFNGNVSIGQTGSILGEQLTASQNAYIGSIWNGQVSNSNNNNSELILLHRLGQGQGFQFSGDYINNSWTGNAFISMLVTARYDNNAVEWTVSHATSTISKTTIQLVTATYNSQSWLCFLKNGGGTGVAYFNAFVGTNASLHGGIRAVTSGYTVTTTHVTLN